MSELNKEIIERIIKMLHAKKYRQADLTNYLGLEKTAFTDWKKGKSSSYMTYLVDIAEFFGISIDYLVYGKNDGLTQNETEMLRIFRRFSEHEQLNIIDSLKTADAGIHESKIIGQKIARRTDGEAIRAAVTEDEFRIMEELPEETDF